MYKLKRSSVQADIMVLKRCEAKRISLRKAMECIEFNNDIEFEDIEQFKKWARGLGYDVR
jgi:hypothetical protein